ncbi:MAG: hypothetical protein R2834_13055 [Rhodothermales bacterium]
MTRFRAGRPVAPGLYLTRYTDAGQVNPADLGRWLSKAREIQWDYKNIVRRKGALERLV